MSTNYRDLVTNLTTPVHDDASSARTRVREALTLLEHAQVNGTDGEEFTAAIDGLRAVEQRLAEAASR